MTAKFHLVRKLIEKENNEKQTLEILTGIVLHSPRLLQDDGN